MGDKGLKAHGCVFSKMLILIMSQLENSTATGQGREEGDEKPAGAVWGGVTWGEQGSLGRLPMDGGCVLSPGR